MVLVGTGTGTVSEVKVLTSSNWVRVAQSYTCHDTTLQRVCTQGCCWARSPHRPRRRSARKEGRGGVRHACDASPLGVAAPCRAWLARQELLVLLPARGRAGAVGVAARLLLLVLCAGACTRLCVPAARHTLGCARVTRFAACLAR